MATTSKSEKVLIGIDDKVIELTGNEKDAFLADQKARAESIALTEAEFQNKQDSRESALKKLAEIAGLTKEELASIL